MASHATSTHSGFRLSHPVTKFTQRPQPWSPSPPPPSRPTPSAPASARVQAGRQTSPPAPAHRAGWNPPDHKGAGEGEAEVGLHPLGLQGQVPHGREMPLPPVGPGRHPLRRGRIRLPGGEGDLRAASLSSSGTCTRWCGVNRGRVRGAGRPATRRGTRPTDREKCARRHWRKREQGWNNATMKRTNWTKFTQIHVKFLQTSYKFHRTFCIHTHSFT